MYSHNHHDEITLIGVAHYRSIVGLRRTTEYEIHVHFCKSCGRFWFHSDIMTHILPRGRRWKTASILRSSCKKKSCPVSSFDQVSLFYFDMNILATQHPLHERTVSVKSEVRSNLISVRATPRPYPPWHHRVSPHLESEATPWAVWSLPRTGSAHVKHTKYTSPNAKRGVHLPHQLANLRGGQFPATKTAPYHLVLSLKQYFATQIFSAMVIVALHRIRPTFTII